MFFCISHTAFSSNSSQTRSSVPIFMNLLQRCTWYITPQTLWSRGLYSFLLNYWLTYVIKENQDFNFLDSTISWQMGNWSVVYIHLERFCKILCPYPFSFFHQCTSHPPNKHVALACIILKTVFMCFWHAFPPFFTM